MVKLYRGFCLFLCHRAQNKLESEIEWYKERLSRLEKMEKRWLRRWDVFDAVG